MGSILNMDLHKKVLVRQILAVGGAFEAVFLGNSDFSSGNPTLVTGFFMKKPLMLLQFF